MKVVEVTEAQKYFPKINKYTENTKLLLRNWEYTRKQIIQEHKEEKKDGKGHR